MRLIARSQLSGSIVGSQRNAIVVDGKNMEHMEANMERLKELVLYISSKCAFNPKYGVTKLNKILFYADFLAYRHEGSAVTGFQYQKLPHGPVPKKMKDVFKRMEADGILARQIIALPGGKKQIRPVGLRKANLSVFTAEQIALVDALINDFGPMHTEEVSEISHQEIGWRAARLGERIPYSTAHLSTEAPNAYDFQRASKIR